MPRYDDRDRYGHRYGGDRYGSTRLYVGHLSSRTRSRDLEDLFSRYGREVRNGSLRQHSRKQLERERCDTQIFGGLTRRSDAISTTISV